MRVSLVIPLYNQVHYTKQCLESICAASEMHDIELILVDNASSDGTAAYLDTVDCQMIRINNNENKGFAGACNQGILRSTAPWIIVMNNDVIVAKGWIDGLMSAAREYRLDCVTPGIREGALQYDFTDYSQDFVRSMRQVLRRGVVNGICFAAKREVFDAVGLFDENFLYGQYEDADLFKRMTQAGFSLGTTGRSFIHHFGSITQKGMGVQNKVSPHVIHNKRYFIKKWKQSRIERLIIRNTMKLRVLVQSTLERYRYGHSLFEKLIDMTVKYY